MGVKCILPKVSDEEIANLTEDDVLKRDHKGRIDRRGAQVVANYDRVYISLQELIVKHTLPPPMLFQTGPSIDRTSLIYFYTEPQVNLFILFQTSF